MLIGLNQTTSMLTCSVIERILVKYYLKLFKVNWNWILTDDYAWIVLYGFDLSEPRMLTDILRCVSFRWISVEDLLEKVAAVITDEFRYRVISIQNLFVKHIRLWILKRQIATNHSV